MKMLNPHRSALSVLLICFLIFFTKMLCAAEKIPKLKPIEKPPEQKIVAAINKGVQFLLSVQNQDGSWGSAKRTKGLNIYAPVPGAHQAFRTAVTSLCISALYEIESEDDKVLQALKRGEDWLLENLPHVRRATPDAIYNVWAHGYSIQALVRMYLRVDDAPRQKKIVKMIKEQYDYLDRYESVDGGWGYYDFRAGTKKPASSSISFTTATMLVAFHEANMLGVKPPEKLVKRAVAAIIRQKKPDFSYAYGEYLKMSPMAGINRPGGSLGRSQACNLALYYWEDGKVTQQVMRNWLHRLFARNGWLDIGRKRPVPHESWFAVAGYFYYYGHYYGAICIEQLPTVEQTEFQAHMAKIIMRLQEKDGSWWDYPFYDYHQPYGTAFAIMTLQRCLKPVRVDQRAANSAILQEAE